MIILSEACRYACIIHGVLVERLVCKIVSAIVEKSIDETVIHVNWAICIPFDIVQVLPWKPLREN